MASRHCSNLATAINDLGDATVFEPPRKLQFRVPAVFEILSVVAPKDAILAEFCVVQAEMGLRHVHACVFC